jgi:riboflavin synthase alpha subunit
VANDLSVGVGGLSMTVNSAHINETEIDLMKHIIAATEG